LDELCVVVVVVVHEKKEAATVYDSSGDATRPNVEIRDSYRFT
jgi:hypothetical protein